MSTHLYAEDISVNQSLPEFTQTIRAKHIISGAAASRDWQPQHHDHGFATEKMNLPDIILNTPAQGGWLIRAATDWLGAHARIARMRFQMKSPVTPNDRMEISGSVIDIAPCDQGWSWLKVVLTLSRNNDVLTTAELIFALPKRGGSQPWQAAEQDWRPPQWDLTR